MLGTTLDFSSVAPTQIGTHKWKSNQIDFHFDFLFMTAAVRGVVRATAAAARTGGNLKSARSHILITPPYTQPRAPARKMINGNSKRSLIKYLINSGSGEIVTFARIQ